MNEKQSRRAPLHHGLITLVTPRPQSSRLPHDTHNIHSRALSKRDNYQRIADHNGGSARVLPELLYH
jgi:hypothetical protein